MDLSELIFTSMGPLLYNLIFLVLWILWIDFHYKGEKSTTRKAFNNYLKNDRLFYLATGLVIIIFLYLLFSYAIHNTDVDDAITSGVEAFLNGHNPYQKDVVVHHLPSGVIYGRYHYFPPDLLTYSAFYLVGGQLFLGLLDTYWFVPLHLLFLIPGYWLISQTIDWPHQKRLLFYSLLLIPFLFTNSMLMWIFFLLGYYFYEEKHQHDLGMIFYVLAASVKYLVGFIIVFYLIQSINKIIKAQKNKQLQVSDLRELRPYLLGSLVLVLISLPFNLIDVIVSVFLYQGDPSSRGEVAQSVGPILIEILKIVQLESLYLICATLIVIIGLFLLRKHTTFEKIMHFSFLSMLILPFYGTELFIILPFYWWLKEGTQELKLTESNLSVEDSPNP